MTKVKLKDIEIPECIFGPKSTQLWKLWRGKTITIGKAEPNKFTRKCNSDVQWEVLTQEMIDDCKKLNHNKPFPTWFKVTVCRHMIEAGD